MNTEVRPNIEIGAPEKWVRPEVVALSIERGIVTTRQFINAGGVPTVRVGKVALVPRLGFANWMETTGICAPGKGLDVIAAAETRHADIEAMKRAEKEEAETAAIENERLRLVVAETRADGILTDKGRAAAKAVQS